MGNDEKCARRIIALMKRAKTGAGEIMMRGALDAAFLRDDTATRAELEAGAEFAAKMGWIELAGSGVRLTEVGAKF